MTDDVMDIGEAMKLIRAADPEFKVSYGMRFIDINKGARYLTAISVPESGQIPKVAVDAAITVAKMRDKDMMVPKNG